jgi:glycine/D-amino acid oxidase-like deaminating enzyme
MLLKPYWTDGLPPASGLAETLPAKVDVLIVGSGYTGLNAAIETVRGGRSTLVVDAGDPGHGCSTRNGGQVGTSIKPSLSSLTQKYGAERAAAIRGEGMTALEWIEERIRAEGIDCDFRRTGRFHAAHSQAKFEGLAADVAGLRKEGIEVEVVTRADQRREICTDGYYGGLVYPRHAQLQPAKYHRGLLNAALGAEAMVAGQAAVTAIRREGQEFVAETAKGQVRARDVIVATNGYTGPFSGWHRRRVIPIGSYIIATEELPKELISELFPTDRVVTDTRKVVCYYRTSPDGRRVIFGGRVSAYETEAALSSPALYENMCRLFPGLSGSKITHSWSGTVAYTFDELAHIGVHDGIHYSMGYCGSGVSTASYFGMRLGQKVLGRKEGQTAFDGLGFPTRPFYTGKPWFLPATVAWYRWRDARDARANRG